MIFRRACLLSMALIRPDSALPSPGRASERSPQDTPSEWRGSIAARWTLVAVYERDGEQFLIARRKEISEFARNVLASRELQAICLLGRGLTNKEVAFEMGVSASTIGVLLWRAAIKLGTRGRRELIRAGIEIEQSKTQGGSIGGL